MIRAVVFDLDDTLFPEAAYVASGFRAVGEALAAAGARGDVLDEALRQSGIASAVSWCVARYREHRPDITLFPEALEVLEYLRGKVKTGLLTDGRLVAQKSKVAALGPATRVDAVVYSDSFGRENWKPSAVPYRAVAEALGVAHDARVYVADNPQKDFITARNLRWRTIQSARPGQTHTAAPPSAAHATDLRAALAVLAGWMG